MITPEEAANLFIERIIFNAYHGVYQFYETNLAEGLPGRVDDPYETEKWYQNLDENSKDHVKEIVKAAIKETVFEFLSVLDNITDGNAIHGQASDFVLYLQTYADSEAMAKNKPLEAIRFNYIRNELHDLFISTLDEPLNI